MDASTRERANHTALTSVSLVRDFEVRHDGVLVEVPPIAQRVLCFLALHERPVRRAYVSGSLWPEADERHAGASLRSALWRVPTPGERPMVRASTTHLWLDKAVVVDLHDLLEQSVAMCAPDAVRLEWADVARALWFYGHDLLTGWYDEWAVAERERFRQVRLHVLDQIGERLFADGRHHEALEVALAVVAAEPLRESAHRLLLRVHLHEGNIAEAFRQYRTYADLLARDIGAAPSPVMTDLLAPYRCAAASGRTSPA